MSLTSIKVPTEVAELCREAGLVERVPPRRGPAWEVIIEGLNLAAGTITVISAPAVIMSLRNLRNMPALADHEKRATVTTPAGIVMEFSYETDDELAGIVRRLESEADHPTN